ncbi:hypothetical protein FPANT_5763 [Fusarium pseudoanthophilum]|uniref:Uncharacterized protein n=1 Tax=Fusarium pseudoanthophilum TaxID=48495 RepID=A0A8H5P6Y6_9HYPO|nr:hypothetical protein FPANT_5763 [Fusarium pseudoanthophilum]
MSTSLVWNNQNGTLAINRDNLRDFYAQSLQNYLPSVCFQIEAHCEAHHQMDCDMSFFIPSGGQPNLSQAAGETVLSYSYSNQDHDGVGINNNVAYFMLGTTYNMNMQFTNASGGASIVITQHLVINYDIRKFSTASSGNAVDRTIVDTYTLTVDERGMLSAGLDSQTTDNSTATADNFQALFNDSDAFMADMKSPGDALVSTGTLNFPLSNKATYSFPSGQTSTFKGVQFSDTQDLVAAVA